MSAAALQKEIPKFLVIIAFACVYIIWGSTYLAIALAIKSIPPFLMVGSRFLVAGLILISWRLLKGDKIPSIKTIGKVAVGGVFMLSVGNGGVCYAEQYLPSGLAAIIVATVPIWFVILDKRQWSFYFSNKLIIIGCLIGFGGVLMLFAGKGSAEFTHNKMKLLGFLVLLIGTIGWAVGSLISKYQKVDVSISMKVALQMIAAGIVSTFAGLLSKETINTAAINAQSFEAWVYLIIMGSLVAYMAYIWLLSVRPPSLVGTYAYVNPVVAVFLGRLLVNEPISQQQVIALAVILAGVLLINVSKDKTPKEAVVSTIEIEKQ